MSKIAISMGCPCGIGPEVTVAALRSVAPAHPDQRFVVHGDAGALAAAEASRGVSLRSMPNVEVVAVGALTADERRPGAPGIAAGRAQFDALERALDAVRAGEAAALVTGPVDKGGITRAGIPFKGHTEHLAARCGVARVVMMFAGPLLKTSLVTTHRAIAQLSSDITAEAVAETTAITARALRSSFGVARPHLVVCGLNPHAGEGGMFGREEIDAIAPGVSLARERLGEGFAITGPMGAESAFRKARDGRFDAVVAMFHDQATIASKLLDFGSAVNVTLGLPIIRTSVDHGTGADIAGQGVADEGGMVAALERALSMVASR